MASESAGGLTRIAQRIAAAPVLERLDTADPETVSFRYLCAEPDRANAHLAAALRTCGYGWVEEVQFDGRTALCCACAGLATDEAVDALINAAIVLGAVAANGQPVPASVTVNLCQDGLPAYIGFAGLWRLEVSGIEIATLGPLLEARLARDPENARAMMDIATLMILTLILENRAPALAMQQRALEKQAMYRLPARRAGVASRVLAIAGPGDMTALTHLDCLLEDSDVELMMLYARPGRSLPEPLPDHDAMFVVIGESVPNRPLLEQIVPVTQASPKRVFNPPERILGLSRDRVSATLGTIEGVLMPGTSGVTRQDLRKLADGDFPIDRVLEDGRFPIIARPLDSQGGKDLDRLADPAALDAYLKVTAGEFFYISRFVDYSSADGLYRKYRVVMIDGRPFACHMAISAHWMIHYVNADMDESADKRAEEARFMAQFDTGFAARHGPCLARIDRLLGLDYYAIDCAETPEGRLLVFEADTAMLVHAMDRTDLYPYKQPYMEKLFAAFRLMLDQAKDPGGVRD